MKRQEIIETVQREMCLMRPDLAYEVYTAKGGVYFNFKSYHITGRGKTEYAQIIGCAFQFFDTKKTIIERLRKHRNLYP